MFVKPIRVAAALCAAMAACLLVANTADAALHRRLTVRMMKPRLIPAHVKAGYVGAPGYPYGPPGPVRPMLVDIPPAGFFTPAGFIQTPVGYVQAGFAEVPGIVPGVIGLGTGLGTAVVGAGTGVVTGGVGYIIPPGR